MPSAATASLATWIDEWADQYPANGDALVEELWGAKELDSEGWTRVVTWKLQLDRRWQALALAALANEPEDRLRMISRDARRCEDDFAALQVVRAVPGVGKAIGSAVLAIMEPERWTVYDWRAQASLKALARDYEFADPEQLGYWREYLATCRHLRDQQGTTLRHIDRALWAAKGEIGLPAE
jgi:hypothetical protein